MDDKRILETARNWLEQEIPGTTYYYERYNPDHDSVMTEAFTHPIPNEDPERWLTVHRVQVFSSEIVERKGSNSTLVKLRATLTKSEGDRGETDEEEQYCEDFSYSLRISDGGEVDLENIE